jgi:hypothetical protein
VHPQEAVDAANEVELHLILDGDGLAKLSVSSDPNGSSKETANSVSLGHLLPHTWAEQPQALSHVKGELQ